MRRNFLQPESSTHTQSQENGDQSNRTTLIRSLEYIDSDTDTYCSNDSQVMGPSPLSEAIFSGKELQMHSLPSASNDPPPPIVRNTFENLFEDERNMGKDRAVSFKDIQITPIVNTLNENESEGKSVLSGESKDCFRKSKSGFYSIKASIGKVENVNPLSSSIKKLPSGFDSRSRFIKRS